MRHDHFCFGLFLTLLFIAPKLPVGMILEGGSPLSSLSLGFVGLLFWLIVSPKLLFYFGRRLRSSWGVLVVFFTVYAWIVSAFSGSTISILYATQYLFYGLFGFLILGSYLWKASTLDELDKVFSVIIVIGTIYSIGVLVSIFTGPIYPHQTLSTARLWGGFRIQQGVGFSENQNGAGGVLIFFLVANIFLYPHRWRWQLLAIGVMGLALLMTLSRSAIFSFMLGCIVLLSIWFLRILFTKRVNRRSVHRVMTSAFLIIGVLIMAVLGYFLFLSPPNQRLILSILSGFGIGDAPLLYKSVIDRLELWSGGLNWWIRGKLSALFGVGFRNSIIIGEYGAWSTPHNFYINILGDFGLVGFLMFISALIGSISYAVSRMLISQRKSGAYPFVFLFISALSIHNLTGTFLYSPIYLTLLLFSILLLRIDTRRAQFDTTRLD